ncbi:rhotekin-like isoform X2 [Babylonia areolata]|uniref:rhotekin-like isoform X2 n=1 Tax=Babylonia areolata TaxID=304850 RepID=UPI003FD002EE
MDKCLPVGALLDPTGRSRARSECSSRGSSSSLSSSGSSSSSSSSLGFSVGRGLLGKGGSSRKMSLSSSSSSSFGSERAADTAHQGATSSSSSPSSPPPPSSSPEPLILQDMSLFYYRQLAASLKDTDLQQKIDHEIKMREGTTKLLAASKHPNQLLEAARSLLCSNTRIIAYMTELQRRKTQEVLGQSQLTEGNQLPCKAQISVSDIRIPLMWKDTDHFKNKGDYRQYAVFCLLKVGTEIYDTSMITNVDRSMTDMTFEDVILFQNIPHDFELKLEVYCHKLHEELSMANTPKKIRKKITDISGSVGRSVGKRLSGLNDADVIGSMVLGPRFELVAKGILHLQDVHDSVRTFDFELEKNSEGKVHELPLFGNYCCRVAAVPGCLVNPAVSGYLNLQEDDDLSKWRRYWCVLKNLHLACWLSPSDIEVAQPLLSIPVTKSTQISDADPSTCKRAHTFLIKTVTMQQVSQHTLAADSKDELNMWWEGFQQHLLDQALWKHACDEVMTLRSPTKNKVPFYRKSSIYEDTPLIDPDSDNSIVSDLKVDDAQLSQMLSTLMGEANQIRGSPTHGGGASSHS